MATETSFAALPVRQRGTLEIIDTAMKLYRRYFGVLMGWSALVAVMTLLSSMVPFGAFLVYPLIAGSGCCAIAAAVRGQTIGFSQVWDFTKPRYGALMLLTFLSTLLMGVAVGVVFIAAMIIALAGVWLMSLVSAPDAITGIVGVIGVIVAMIVGSVLSVFAYAWLGLVPIIACLEDDKRSTAAMGRAWELMKGSWARVLGLSTLLSIAVLAIMGIVGGSMALYGQGMGLFTDDISESAILGLGLTFSAFIGLFFLFWNPIQTLVLAVLYLDLRVRKEALDLEWSSYASAPPQDNASELGAVDIATHSLNPSDPEFSPASMSGYEPGSLGQSVRPPHPATAPDIQSPTPPQMRPPAPPTSAFAPEPAPAISSTEDKSNSIDVPANVQAPQSSAAPDSTVSLSKETNSSGVASSSPDVTESFDFSSTFNQNASGTTSFSPDSAGEQSSADSTKPSEDA